jgi:Tfp pilus assembly protein PilZ
VDAEAQPRIAKRMPCAVHVGKRRYSGIVLNVSQGGLFVQTSARASRGASIDLELSAPERLEGIGLRASVVWKRVVPHQLRSAAQGGMGVKILRADEHYYQLLAEWMRVTLPSPNRDGDAPVAAAPPAVATLYRVRVLAGGGPRTRLLSIQAASAEAACAEAVRCAGAGWRVIDVEAV